MCFLSPETIKSTPPQDCSSQYAIVHGIGRQRHARQLIEDNRTRADVLYHGHRIIGVQELPQTLTAENFAQLTDLRGGCHELDLAAQPCLIQLIRWGALGDQGADQDVGVKNDPHAPH